MKVFILPLSLFLTRVVRNLLKPAGEVNFTGRFDNALRDGPNNPARNSPQ